MMTSCATQESYRLFQIVLSAFPSSSDVSTHFHIETPSNVLFRNFPKEIYENPFFRTEGNN